jgi:hypothetical protein
MWRLCGDDGIRSGYLFHFVARDQIDVFGGATRIIPDALALISRVGAFNPRD